MPPSPAAAGDLDALRIRYRSTDYLAFDGSRKIVARLDRMNPDLDALLARRGAAEAVFLTAWNPRSAKTDAATNAAAHARLLEILEDEDLDWLKHRGEAQQGDWLEEGVLILDLPPFDALQLAEMFGQNAIVWQAHGQPAALLFTTLALAG